MQNEEEYLNLLKENGDLKIQISKMSEQLNMSLGKMEELTKLLENDDARKMGEME